MAGEPLIALLTALGDDEIVLGHRHSEWTGFAPHLEEDVAFSSIAQDEIGHAAAYYSLVAKLTGDSADRLALGRAAEGYRNAIICERPNGEWGYTLVRHWLYDVAESLRLETLEGSADPQLAALATKIRREERYHLIHASTWMKRVARGPVDGRTRLIDAIASAVPETAGLFEPFELEDECIKAGWLTVPSAELQTRFITRIQKDLDELGLPAGVTDHATDRAEFVASSSGDLISGQGEEPIEPARSTGLGGRRGQHTADFEELHSVMTSQFMANPGARW